MILVSYSIFLMKNIGGKKKCTKVKADVGDPDGDVISQIGCLAQLGKKTYQSYYLLSDQPTV